MAETSTRARTATPPLWRRLVPVVAFLLTAGLAFGWLVGGRGGSDNAAAGGTRESSSPVLEIPPAERGEPVDAAGRTLAGDDLSLAQLRGGVAVVNVWGSWCGPCRVEAPVLAAAAREHAPWGVRFLGINTRDNAPAARAFEDRYGITYPSLADEDGALLLAFRGTVPPQAVPSTLVLDPQGRVAARVVGEIREATLRALLDRVLTEPNGPTGPGTP